MLTDSLVKINRDIPLGSPGKQPLQVQAVSRIAPDPILSWARAQRNPAERNAGILTRQSGPLNPKPLPGNARAGSSFSRAQVHRLLRQDRNAGSMRRAASPTGDPGEAVA